MLPIALNILPRSDLFLFYNTYDKFVQFQTTNGLLQAIQKSKKQGTQFNQNEVI